MDKDLAAALNELNSARKRLRLHFTKYHWPVFYEDLDYIIKAIRDVQQARANGESLPV